MNILPRDKQIEIVSALTEGMSIRSIERLTEVHRDTIMRLGVRVGQGCARFHDRTVLGVRVGRIELDEAWSFVGKKQRNVSEREAAIKGDHYVFIALAAASKAILSYRVGKRDGATTENFIFDLRERVIGNPELSTDAWKPYQPAIRAAFGERAIYGQISKTYKVVDLRRSASQRYSPAEVVAVSRDVVSGIPGHISTSYVERRHLSLRMSQRRFGRLTNAFST
jgi:IS1 family transposase